MRVGAGPEGIAVLVDEVGAIDRVLSDKSGFASPVPARSPFVTLCEDESSAKAFRFLDEVRQLGVARGWELVMRTASGPARLDWQGARVDHALLLVGGRSPNDISGLCDEMMRVSNELTNRLRAALTELALRAELPRSRRSDDLFDELTRVNNELATLHRETAQKNAALEALNRQKNQLLGMAAHDLRNPLGVIAGYARMLHAGTVGPLNEKQRKFLASIESSSLFMRELVEDLLDLSAIEASEVKLACTELDLAVALREDVELNRIAAGAKGIAVETGDLAPARLRADRGKLRQVVTNLIDNAVKYSHPGTVVRVTASVEGQQMRVSVSDQGQGIPAPELDGLFEAFGRASTRSTAGEKSTGLGLAIVRHIVEAHGGRVTVESQVGKGSTFAFTLPLAGPLPAGRPRVPA